MADKQTTAKPATREAAVRRLVKACAGIMAYAGMEAGDDDARFFEIYKTDIEALGKALHAVQASQDEPARPAPALLNALRDLIADFEQTYDELTDGQYAKPNTPAYLRAKRLLKRLG